MNKILLALSITSSFAFSQEVQQKNIEFVQVGCSVLKLSEDTSLLSCPTGDFKLIYKLDSMDLRKNHTVEIIKLK